jgi:putative membrane protein
VSAAGNTRKPRAFSADDPALVCEPGVEGEPRVQEGPTSQAELHQMPARPWAGPSWGAVLISALAGAAILAAGTWFAGFVAVALVRDDWVGWTVLALLLIAAFAGVMIALREIVGLSRLGRLNRLKGEVRLALEKRDTQLERAAALRLARLYAGRPHLSWALRRFREATRDVLDSGETLALAEREIMATLDREARLAVTRSAKRVATVTALSPIMFVSILYVLIENLRLLRSLAALYGGRPGGLGALRLARMVLVHIVATGGVAMTDDLLGQFLGQDVLRRLSRRLGEGAFNGALTARIGIAGIEVIRPLPFLTCRPPRARDVLTEALKRFKPAREQPAAGT